MVDMNPLKPLQPMPLSMMQYFRESYIVQGWLVLMLCFFFGGTLSGVQLKLNPIIEENKANETKQRIPELLLGPGEAQLPLDLKLHTIEVEKKGRKVFYNVYEARFADGKLAGWVTKAVGQGYADKIELLLGLDPNAEKITGVFILDQKETPGLGNKIVTEKWRSQFAGKETRQLLTVVKGGVKADHEIDAISGATISSKSVTAIINTAVNDLKGKLRG